MRRHGGGILLLVVITTVETNDIAPSFLDAFLDAMTCAMVCLLQEAASATCILRTMTDGLICAADENGVAGKSIDFHDLTNSRHFLVL